MSKDASADNETTREWATDWLVGVAGRASTMSQRKLSSIERRGGLEAVRVMAEEMGVHLLLLEDDRGNEIVAASTKPFKVIC